MKRMIFLIGVVMMTTLTGCSFYSFVAGSGTPITLQYSLSGFTCIQASQSFAVQVVPDASFSVTVTFDDNLAPYILVQTQGDSTLVLGLKQGYSYQNVHLSAVVHMPAISTLDGSGACGFQVDAGYSSAAPVSIALSGASTFACAGMTCGDVTVDVSGASSATLAGSAANETIIASGASRANLINCAGISANVTLSGASEAWVEVGRGDLVLSASGASTLYYGGSPALHLLDLSGASKIVQVY
ncbi:MAG: DUF2807 domain-containing protein [Spirochaetia bacterium]